MGFLYLKKDRRIAASPAFGSDPETERQGKTAGGTGTSYAAITGYEGAVSWLRVPERIGGLPVEEIADHAFSGRQDLHEAFLPESVRKLGRFCFYDCGNLERVTLFDSVLDYYDGVIRACGNLQEIVITIRRGRYRVMKEMMEDNREVLHFRLILPSVKDAEKADGGTEVRLTIPAYHDEDREDTMARAIHPKIVGAGYAYRQTVTREGILYGEYDRLFPKSVTDDPRVAAEIALDRLIFPYQLKQADRDQYAGYVQAHAADVLRDLIEKGDAERLGEMLRTVHVGADALDAGIALAAGEGRTEMAGQLMEYSRRENAAGRKAETFAL